MSKLAEYEVERYRLQDRLAKCEADRSSLSRKLAALRLDEPKIRLQLVLSQSFNVIVLLRRITDATIGWRLGGIMVVATVIASLLVILTNSLFAFFWIPLFFLIGFLTEQFLPDSRILSVKAERTKRYRIWNDRMAPLRARKLELDEEYRNLVLHITQVSSTLLRLIAESAIAERSEIPFLGNSRVEIRGVRVFGRGLQCCYAYSFPSDIELARLKGLNKHPVKVGMTTKSNPVERITEQVQSSSTALPEKPRVLLVFYCNNAADLERNLHRELKARGEKVEGSIGTEWFETNSEELIALFRESVRIKEGHAGTTTEGQR